MAGGNVSPQEFLKQVYNTLPGGYCSYIYIVSNTFDFETQNAEIENLRKTILTEDDTRKIIVVIPNEKISAFKECFKNIHFEEETIPSNIYQQVEKSVQESCDGVHVTLGTIEIGKIQEPVSPEIPTLKIPITPKSNSQKWIYSGIALIVFLVGLNIFITLYGFQNTKTLLDSTCFEEELQELQELRELKETQGQTITDKEQLIKDLRTKHDALQKTMEELVKDKGISEPAKLFEPLLPTLQQGDNQLVVGTYGKTHEELAQSEVNRLKNFFSSQPDFVGYQKTKKGSWQVYLGDFYENNSCESLEKWAEKHGIISEDSYCVKRD
ncbi:hypothetical protein BGP_2207 [Beggiatoa sp. PS]|nr:hypothetical protein BGP_2207 [Beggiatoa sp. PS]